MLDFNRSRQTEKITPWTAPFFDKVGACYGLPQRSIGFPLPSVILTLVVGILCIETVL